MHLVALERNARGKGQQRWQHEAVEGRLVQRCQIDAAENDAEQADDQQRLVPWIARYEPRNAGDAPKRTRNSRAEPPPAPPVLTLCAGRRRHVIAAHELVTPRLI